MSPSGLWMRAAAALAVPLAVLLVVGCGSLQGRVSGAVYVAPDESFELRLPAGVRPGGVTDEFRDGGLTVVGRGSGGRTWRLERYLHGEHHIARTDPDLPQVTRLLFAESSWAGLTGAEMRPSIERQALTMPGGGQALLSIRRADTSLHGGLEGLLVFESGSCVNLLVYRDPQLGRSERAVVRGELVSFYQGLTIHD